jgi:Protein of unknown function (DUF3631)
MPEALGSRCSPSRRSRVTIGLTRLVERHSRLSPRREQTEPSLGVRLLADIKTCFEAGVDKLTAEALLGWLHRLDEAQWSDLHGKPLDARGLADRLRPYDVRPHTIRVGDKRSEHMSGPTSRMPGVDMYPLTEVRNSATSSTKGSKFRCCGSRSG